MSLEMKIKGYMHGSVGLNTSRSESASIDTSGRTVLLARATFFYLRVHLATRFDTLLHTRLFSSPTFLSSTYPPFLFSISRKHLSSCPLSQVTMSDLEPSAAASSSPSLPATDSNALSYAFLVHSQKTLTQNLPPRVDNKLLARQKRRRTR